MTRPDGVPEHAEQFAEATYFKSYDLPSELLPNVKQRVWRLHCPQCGAVHKDPFTTIYCGCGLTLKLDVTGLYVWREKETA